MGLSRRAIYDLVDSMYTESIRLVISCESEKHAETLLKQLEGEYSAFLQSSAICPYEVVITDGGK